MSRVEVELVKLRNDVVEPWWARAGQRHHYKVTRRRAFVRLHMAAGWREAGIGLSIEDVFRRGHGLLKLAKPIVVPVRQNLSAQATFFTTSKADISHG